MSDFFVSRDAVTHVITHPDTGEEATVEIRRMNAGDQVAIQDSIRMNVNEDGIEDAEIRAGTYRKMLVERLLVAWSLPLPVTPTTLDQLDPRIYNAIAELCATQPVGGNATPLADSAS